MKKQTDIRRYGAVVRRHGWWIAILAVVAATLTYLIGIVVPETYTAAALVGIIDRSNVVAFDPRFLPIERDLPTFEPYPALASSDAVLSDLLDRLGDEAPGDGSLEALRGRLVAALAADKVLLRLTASADTPEDAAELANAWAEVVVAHASELYEAMDVALLARYEELLEEAAGELATARAALVEHDIAAAERGLAENLAAVEREAQRLQDELLALRVVQRDAQAARAALNGDQRWDADSLARAVASLQARALQPLTEDPLSLGPVRDDPAGALDLVDQVLTQRIRDAAEALTAAQAEAVRARHALAEQAAERDNLALAVRQAEDRVLLLSKQAEQVRLAADDSRIKVQLTSRAALPTRPSAGGASVLSVGAAALAGVLFGTALALFVADERERSGGSTPLEP